MREREGERGRKEREYGKESTAAENGKIRSGNGGIVRANRSRKAV